MVEKNKELKNQREIITLADNDYGIAYHPAKIDFPEYGSLKAKVQEISELFKYQVTADNISQAKKDRANLNKLKKALNDRKISIVKDVDQPVIHFKSQIKELTDDIGQTTDLISKQIKGYEDHAREEREQLFKNEIKRRCEIADIDPQKIVMNPKWLNKSASYAVFENELQAQIDSLAKEKEQIAENIKVVSARAKELGLPYQHWAQLLESTKLSSVLEQMSDYANDIKKEAERNKTAKQEAQAKIVNHNGTAINKDTGEIIDTYQEAMLITKTTKLKLTATNTQFKQLWQAINNIGIKHERITD